MTAILHVGLPKTGTTFLQRHYFTQISGYHVISSDELLPRDFSFIYKLNRDADRLPRPPFIRKFRRSESRLNLKKIRSRITRFKKNSDLPILLSCEGLAGISFSPLRNNLEVSLLLKAVLDVDKVILTIRRQDLYAQSLYRQLVFEENRFGRFVEPENFISTKPQPTAISSAVELNWLSLYQNYVSIFGKENVLCLPYEEMIYDLPVFIERINAFLGVTPDLPENFFSLKERVSNVNVRYACDHLKVFHEFDKEFLRKLIVAQYDNNMLLARLLCRDLSLYGYHH